MATLVSPGVSVTITDESQYATSGQGTIPLIVMATASNKASPISGGGIAPYTVPAQANNLYLATSQQDLIQNFGNPIFQSTQGTPLNGNELNEYGLWAAYSYLGIANQCYVLRANIDLASLAATTTAPFGPPLAGTYWFDTSSNTSWGVFRANGSTSPGAAWNLVTVLVAQAANVGTNNPNPSHPLDSEQSNDTGDANWPSPAFGAPGNVCVVPTTASNYLYENIANVWYRIGSDDWMAQYPTVVTGTMTSATLVHSNTFSINGTLVTISTGTTIATLVTDINTAMTTANVTTIHASQAVNNALKITNTAGGPITLTVGTGTPLASLGLTAGTTNGVSVTRNNNASYPAGNVTGSFWVKGNPANNGASWSVKFYNGTTAAWTLLTAPFYPFDSVAQTDTAALAAIVTPTVGNVYVGYDVTTGDQQLRRWSGSVLGWQPLTYEASGIAPSTAPAAGTNWYNTNFAVDIMYGNGENWLGYRTQFPSTDVNGPQIAGSAPLFQSDGTTALAEGDIWIDGSNLEDYPVISTWNASTLSWNLIDNTDRTTPSGIVFADARQDSGTAYLVDGVSNTSQTAYAFSSTASVDMALSSFVDPDAPDPRTFPAGMLLFNTRYSTYNVKQYNPIYFKPGGFSANTDYTFVSYNVGDPNTFEFPPLASAARWVTASGNQINGTPYMGRKAQRIMVVTAIGAAITSNQSIRSEIIFFNLMAAPGYPEMIPDFISLNTDMNQIAFCVGDTPARLASDATSIQTWATNGANAAVTGEDGLTVSDDYTGLYYPWGLGTNLDGTEIMIPPSAIALVTIAYNDQVAYPWYAPAGFTRGLVTNATSVGYLASTGNFTPVILNQGQRDVIYTNNINPIAYIPNRGLVVYGQKTLDPTSTALDRINVARLMNYISYNLDIILKPFLFEPNTATTRATVVVTVQNFFSQLVSLNGLYDYAVVCDATNNTPATIDANELWVDCAVQPTIAIEFIYVPVRVLTTQSVS